MRQAVNRRAAQLSKLCIKLNSDDFTVFCDFFGHTNTINIRVHLGGWKEGQSWNWQSYTNLNSEYALEGLEAAIAKLTELKRTGEAPVNGW